MPVTEASNIAGIVAAFGTVITAVGAIWLAYRQQQMNHAVQRNTKKVDGVHVIVNQQRTDMLRFQTALIAALVKHGIDVPVDQSLPTDPYVPLGDATAPPVSEPPLMVMKEVRDPDPTHRSD